MEQRIHDPVKLFEVRMFKYVPVRDPLTFKIKPGRVGVPFDSLDDPKLDDDCLFMVKYPWDNEDVDVWGITELRIILKHFNERYEEDS